MSTVKTTVEHTETEHNTLENNSENNEVDTEDFLSLLEKTLPRRDLIPNTKIEGTVVRIDPSRDEVWVDIGSKSEGRISLREFSKEDIKEGDTVEVFFKRYENKFGEVVISREDAIKEARWFELEEMHEQEKPVEGLITSRVKGGCTVDLGGIIAFLPGSQIDIKPVKDMDSLIGKKEPMIVVKMDRKRGNVVVSRRAVLEETLQESRSELLSTIKEGDKLEGVVKNITDYGAFVDLGGIDGLLHVTDIAWKRVNHPSESLSVGQTIKVKVIKYDDSKKRISLGIKQLESNPWEGIELRYPVGAKFKGKVTNVTDYGVFVELETGIEGLVHVSEMSWTKKNTHPTKIVSIDDDIEVMVLESDESRNRISLGMKQCEENPWAAFTESHKEGDIIEGTIQNVAEFGVFISLGDQIDGLIHVSDLSWEEKPETFLKEYKKGDVIKAKVLSMDVDKERISLGVKQLEDNPIAEAMKGIKKGAAVTCAVTSVRDDGIEVSISEHISAFIKRSDLSRDKQDQRPDRFAEGDRVDAKVLSVEKGGAKINLSIKALEIEEEKKAIAEYGSADSGATLGDILGAALAETETPTPKKEEGKPEVEASEKKPAKKKTTKKSEASDEKPVKKSASKKKDTKEKDAE